jgi:hypothetical protein
LFRKSKKTHMTTKATGVAIGLGIAMVAASSANAETLTALVYNGNNIFQFDSSTPGTLFNQHGVSFLQGGDILVGIDYFGTTLYGVGQAGWLYTINPNTGAASTIGHFTPGGLSGIYYGVNADNGAMRIVSDASIDMLVNLSTGALISSGPSTSTGLSGLASNGNGLFAVDSVANTLGTLDPSTGTYSSIGGMLYDVSGKNGFDISQYSGVAYFASGVSSSGLDANLYTVDLSTGATSLVGTIGPGEGLLVAGLTAVPEPSTMALAILGGAGMIAALRRRK